MNIISLDFHSLLIFRPTILPYNGATIGASFVSNDGNNERYATPACVTLQPYDEINESFLSYLQRLENHITLKDVTDATVKVKNFLNCIGPKYYQIVKNIISPSSPEAKTYEDLVKTLKDHIVSEPGKVAQQHKLCLRQQHECESIANYVAGLKEIRSKCNFICNNCKQSIFETHLRV